MKLRYKYRIYPNKLQEQQMISVGGTTRFIFNYFLKQNIDQYRTDKKFIWYNQMSKRLTQRKKQFLWLKNTYSQILQSSIKDLDQALKNIKHGNKFPKFKSKYTTPISFRYQQHTSIIDNKYLHLPKIGNIKINLHRQLPSKYTGITITQKNNNWYCSFVVNKEEQSMVDNISNSVGIDVNSDFTALSSYELIPNIKPLKQNRKKLKKLQQNLSRKKKGSKNQTKAKFKLAILHEKIANQRHDHIHKLSARITKEHDLICVETLKIEEMKKNKYVAKAIEDCAWAKFILLLEYKCKLLGNQFIKINQWLPSSKTCSFCGNKQIIQLNQRQFNCNECLNSIHRDINAAINIKNYGLQQYLLNTKSRQELPEVPVDVISDLLSNFDNISNTQTKQEIIYN
jgi:putative transposase